MEFKNFMNYESVRYFEREKVNKSSVIKSILNHRGNYMHFIFSAYMLDLFGQMGAKNASKDSKKIALELKRKLEDASTILDVEKYFIKYIRENKRILEIGHSQDIYLKEKERASQ